MKQPARIERNLADYGYPTTDVAALSAKALEVTQRLTERYGELPFSSKDPMSMLVDIILSHRTRDEQTAAAWENLLKRFGSWEAVRDAPTVVLLPACSRSGMFPVAFLAFQRCAKTRKTE